MIGWSPEVNRGLPAENQRPHCFKDGGDPGAEFGGQVESGKFGQKQGE